MQQGGRNNRKGNGLRLKKTKKEWKNHSINDPKFGYFMNALESSGYYPCSMYVDNHIAVEDFGIV